MLVYYTEAEVDLVRLLEVRLHAHDLRESLFCVLQGAIAVVEYAYAIPKLRLLCRRQLHVHRLVREDIPLDLRGGRVLAGKQSKPAAGRPS